MPSSVATASTLSPTRNGSSSQQPEDPRPRLISVSELDKVFDMGNDFRQIRESIHTVDSFMVAEPGNPLQAHSRFYWKMDFCVLPVLGMMLFLASLDQTTFRATRLSGVEDKLALSERQYRISLSLTYIPYVLSPYPSNLLLRRFGPNYVLPGLIVLFGITTLSTGFVKSYEGLLACRFFFGFFEGGLFPVLALYLTSLYPRHELAFRINILAACGFLGYAFSGILDYGISQMEGLSGLSGWSWTYILEGLFTVLFGIISLFLLPRTIQGIQLLNEEEKLYLARILYEDNYGHHQTHAFSMKEIFRVFTGIHVWLGALMSFTTGVKAVGFANSLRTVVDKLNFTPSSKAQSMMIPPYAAALLVASFVGYGSDYFALRGVSIGLSNVLSIIGLGIYFGSQVDLVRYGCLFLVLSGSLSVVGPITAWIANNSFPYLRRATALAICGMMFGMGVLVSVWLVSRVRDDTMTVVLLGLTAAEGLMAIVNTIWLRWKNEMMNCMMENRFGDDSKWFMYTL